jgi:lipopolysaccharide transport system permease protein
MDFKMNRKAQYYIDLILVLTQKDLKVRYKSSILGHLWSVAHPLAFAVVFYGAFKVIVKIPVENYALFLICGLFPWQWFANSLNAAPMIFLGNAPLIKKVNFPRNLLPFTLVLQDMLHFVLAIPVIILFLFFAGKTPGLLWCVGIPVLIVAQLSLVYGICLIIASLNLFFRDLERLTTIFTTILFYATPVFYPETMIPLKFQSLLKLNPLAPLIVNWRNLLLEGTLQWENLLLSLFHGIVFLTLGFFVYRKLSWRFAEVL